MIYGPVQVDVSAVGEVDFRSWEGWVHSRARTLVLGMQVLFPEPPLRPRHLRPECFPALLRDQLNLPAPCIAGA